MNLQEFTPLAVRTESKIDHFAASKFLLTNALRAYIAAGNLLDQIKKNAFYGSDFNLPKYKHTVEELCHEIYLAGDALKHSPESFYIVHNRVNEIPKEQYEANTRAVHALIGTLTESAELAEAFLNYLNSGTLDHINTFEEFGDVFWYYAIFVDEYKLDPSQPLINVINKLKKRYPEKFTQEAAENRDLEAERTILSTNIG